MAEQATAAPDVVLAHAPGADIARVLGSPDAADLALINAIAPEPQTADGVFVFSGAISTDAVDSYYTRMDPETTLPGFAAQMAEGKPLMHSHRTGGLFRGDASWPLGNSYAADLVDIDSAEGEPASVAVVGRWYIQRGLRVDGNATDDVIALIGGGTLRRMSVGARIGADSELVCSECGQDMLDWDADCWHIPGFKARGKGESGDIVTGLWRYLLYTEGSLVYHNAAPGALVSKAERMAREGRLDERRALALEGRYQTRGLADLVTGRAPQYVLTARKQEDKRLDELERMFAGVIERAGKTLSAETRTRLESARDEARSGALSVERGVEIISELLESSDAAPDDGDRSAADIARLEREAELGRAHHAELVERCASEMFRATGAPVGEAMRAQLALLGADELKAAAKGWEEAAPFRAGRATDRLGLADVNRDEPGGGVKVITPQGKRDSE